jgi:hypothetical protein
MRGTCTGGGTGVGLIPCAFICGPAAKSWALRKISMFLTLGFCMQTMQAHKRVRNENVSECRVLLTCTASFQAVSRWMNIIKRESSHESRMQTAEIGGDCWN